jgi:hypothetical protein
MTGRHKVEETPRVGLPTTKPRAILETLEAALWSRLRWLTTDAANGFLYEPPIRRTLRLLALVAEVRSQHGLSRRGSRPAYRK